MSLVSMADTLLVFLWTESAEDPETGCQLSAAVEAVTTGEGQLSQQVEVGMAAETLSERGLVHRETTAEDRVTLWLTEAGRNRAREIHKEITDTEIELVRQDQTETLTVEAAVTHLDMSVPEIAARASDDGVLYYTDRQPAEGIIDREPQRETCKSVFARCRDQRTGQAVFLLGSNGIGKTTLAEVLLDEASEQGVVARAGCDRAATEPYEPIRDLLADLNVETDPFAAAEGAVTTGEQTGALQAQQTALFHDVTQLFVPETASMTVLFLDDLHRADGATIAYLEYLFERLTEYPIVVLATHVPGKVSDSSVDIDEIVSESTPVTRFELDGFDRAETKRLIEQVVGTSGAPDGFVEAVYERTAGTPLYIESTVEALLENDQLDPQFRWYLDSADDIELPDAVRDTVISQVDALDATTKEILWWTAVAGEAVSISDLQSLCDQPPQQVAATVDVLAEAAIFERHDASQTVALRSNLTREALLKQIDQAELTDRHEQFASHLAEKTTDTDEGESHAASIGYHYEQADNVESAIEWYQNAASRATTVYAHETAIEQYHRILEIAREAGLDEEVLSASEKLADIYATIGAYEQADRYVRFIRERVDEEDTERRQRAARLAARTATARGEYERADEEVSRGLDLDETPSEELCRLLGVAARSRRSRGQYDRAREHATRQLDLATELDRPELRAEAMRHLGRISWRQDNYQQAREYFEDCLSIASELDDQAIEAAGYHDIGLVAWEQSNYEEAESAFAEAISIREEIDDRHGRARSVHNMGLVAHSRGNYDRARECYAESRDIEREVGDRHGEAQAIHNLALLAQTRGEYDRARDRLQDCLSLERELDDRRGKATTLHNLGGLALAQGEYERAREYTQEALEINREIEEQQSAATALSQRGIIERRQGNYEQARADHEQSLDIARELSHQRTEIGTLSGLGIDAYRAGEYERAESLYQEALEIARELGTPDEQTNCLRGLGVVWSAQGEYERAREAFEEAIELFEDGDIYQKAQLDLERAQLAHATGNHERAHELGTEAVSAFEQIDATHWIGRGTLLLGKVARARGEPTSARKQFEQALSTFEAVDAPQDAVRALRDLVELADEHTQAREWCEKALDLLAETDPHPAWDQTDWFETKLSELE